jgi:ABC-type uncharacterized transport system involved in gliding motility auxiliary subunit
MYRMVNIIDYVYFPWVNDLDRQHPATKSIDGFTVPFVSPIEIKEKKPGLTYKTLARTSKASYLDPTPYNLSPLSQHPKRAEAPMGPFDVGVLIEGKFNPLDAAAKTGRVLLFGNSRFIRSDYPPRQSNLSLFVNLMDWSIQDELLLSIRSKTVSRRPIRELTDASRLLVKISMVWMLPLLAVVTGLIVWRREKVRRALLPLQYRDA